MRTISKAIITGITGSGGSYLAEHIAKNHPEVEIHGTSRTHTNASESFLSSIADKVKIHECDLLDFSAIFNVLKEVRPDSVFHLAANANVRASWSNPLSVLNNNIMGNANLLEAVRLLELDPVIQICSTSEVYGQVSKEHIPIREDCPISCANPYAVSKLCQDQLGLVYYLGYGMKIIRTRAFGYVNYRRPGLVLTSFAKQIAEIEVGLREELTHGNLDSIRTFLDVRDIVEAYYVATLQGDYGEVYNIGHDVPIRIGDALDLLISLAKCRIITRLDTDLVRPADVTLQIPCVDKFRNKTGWKPKVDFEDSMRDLLNYWRAKYETLS